MGANGRVSVHLQDGRRGDETDNSVMNSGIAAEAQHESAKPRMHACKRLRSRCAKDWMLDDWKAKPKQPLLVLIVNDLGWVGGRGWGRWVGHTYTMFVFSRQQVRSIDMTLKSPVS